MIVLGRYREFGAGDDAPSLLHDLHAPPHPDKERILRYMEHGHIHMVSPGFVTDVVTGEITRKRAAHLNDGVYSWTTGLIYHVAAYDLRLPDDFIRHILSSAE